MNKGIIFDLDGTLWNTEESTFKAANEIVNKYNVDSITKETIKKCMGLQLDDVIKLYFPKVEKDLALKLMLEVEKSNLEYLEKNGGKNYIYLEETIKKLSENYKLFLVSNTNNKKYIEAFLITSNLKDYFTDYIAAGEENISKGEAIIKITKVNNLEKAIYIGDTQKDLEATIYANIPFIYAKYGFGNIEHKYSVENLSELENMIEKVLKK